MKEEKYLDETILEIKRQKDKEENINIEEGVHIKNEYVEFEEIKLFNESMSILLPKSFIDLPDSMKKIKYPSEQRPHIIKTSLDTSVNFGFSLLPLPIRN